VPAPLDIPPIDVPPLVRERALANGNAGTRWLTDLPEVARGLADRWDLELGQAFSGGTSGFVVAATHGSGRRCVLKIAMPLDMDDPHAFTRSVLVHRLAGGRGCAELLAHDESSFAMLMECLGPNLDELGLPLTPLLAAITDTLRSFWRPVDSDVDLPSGADKAEWLARYISTTWIELDRPCDRAVIDRALTYCDDRAAAFDPRRAVLVHGDAHGWNTVAAAGGAFKFVDPEGLRSEREHDLAVAMREYNRPLLAGDTARLVDERAHVLATHCDVDPHAVLEWGFIERVSTGLATLRDLQSADGSAFLEVARRCL
jgi:streptomycin 6-kinase